MFGLFNLYKPTGPTSFDIVARVRRMLPRKVRVGHGGTLDPFAGGVLLVLVGPATRLERYVHALPKRYRATLRLGAVSTTDDPEGRVTPRPDVAAPGAEAIDAAVRRFVGTIPQTPPAHSAARVGGRRAYQLARAGEDVELRPREVTIHAIEPLRYEWPELDIEVCCGSGTYIRALGRDLGEALGVGAYCTALERTAIGPFAVEGARRVEELSVEADLLSPLSLLEGMPRVSVPPEAVEAYLHGKAVRMDLPVSGETVALDPAGRLIGIARADRDAGLLKPWRTFASPGE